MNIESNIKNNSNSFWSFVNTKRKSNGFPKNMSYMDTEGSNVTSILDLFANVFQSVYSTPNMINLPCILNIPSKVDIGDLLLSSSEVLSGLKSLKPKLNSGADGIPAIVLKLCASTLCSPLVCIFNKSLSEGVFLDTWKISYLVPIHKSGSKNMVENYRGISKLSTIPKLFESIVKNKIEFLTKESISELQHGFISGRSTTTNMALFSRYIVNSLEGKCQVDAIYTDFSKAFDSVNHNTLVHKLEIFGFHSKFLSWISSYLTGRSQKVIIDNSLSRSIACTSGVPQGSHLGPLLFNIFINDIASSVIYSKCLLYADDLKLFVKIKCIEDCYLLQSDLHRRMV